MASNGAPVPLSQSLHSSADEKLSRAMLSGKQEHYLKRELISRQTQFEITELSSPTALKRFGAPFSSDAGEVAPEDSDLPLLRYIFVHHVRNFPFLDKAREQEFWQEKLQVFLESFANKNISSSEDRLEETKRKKLAIKAQKLVELMMVSGIPTASGYEERIRFSEMEVVDRGANEQGLIANMPEGQPINGLDVNVAGVRTIKVKKQKVRKSYHAEFLIRTQERQKQERIVGRRYGDFVRLHKRLRAEIPGKVIPVLPRKNKSHTSHMFTGGGDGDDSDSSSSSQSTSTPPPRDSLSVEDAAGATGLKSYIGLGSHKRNSSASLQSSPGVSKASAPRPEGEKVVLYREEQRVSLRAFLRTLLRQERIANSAALKDFLTRDPINLSPEEAQDVGRRKDMDAQRVEEQRKFYEAARRRAKELDVHMEKFRRDIVESNGLTKLFKEIRSKNTIAELSPEYQKFAEWLRIEIAATIYHLFLAEDNAPELFAQAKRIHSLIPYTVLKQTIRFANPALVMKGVLDLFLAQPFGSHSLMQRIFGYAIRDGISSLQKAIDSLNAKIKEPKLAQKIANFTTSSEAEKRELRKEAMEEELELLVVVLRTERLEPDLEPPEVERVFNAYVAWDQAVENPDAARSIGDAELFASLKQLLRLHTRQRDKAQMLDIIQEPVTLQLFRDLFTIFYEPLVRVYKSANVYNSVTDFASFADDAIKVVDAAQRQALGADPNQTVQAFIDLCERHQDDFYKFVHEVHIHDNGLFDQLMNWLEGILEFLRRGPVGGKLDMNALFQGAVASRSIDKAKAIAEIDALVDWQMARKEWHQDKTRRKMATGGNDASGPEAGGFSSGFGGLKSSDFGLNEADISGLGLDDEASDDEDDDADDSDGEDEDPIAAERRRRGRVAEALKSRAGEPKKPKVGEINKMMDG
ncbi:MAG: hypothetical protein Q9162_006180, partial [Coniocarpon cinnabarinum]